MDRLKAFIFILLFITGVSYGFCIDQEEKAFAFDWLNLELEVSGTGDIIPLEHGNIFEWQYDATLKAQTDLLKNFIASMGVLRLDAYNFARDILMREPEKNEIIYNYMKNIKKQTIKYTDHRVIIKTRLPLVGKNGLVRFLITAGTDTGTFPLYDEYIYSTPFTGLVIDARGLGIIPAIGPRIFDEAHQAIYSIDQVDKENFEKWGAVQYTYDPYYKGFKDRVGENPYRIVALENDKLIPTDIAISDEDAKVLLQNDISKQNLIECRVIIILDTVLQNRF